MAPFNDLDVIVVGAGSAGAPLAARLAGAGLQVLLLEAGPDHRGAELPEVLRSPNPIRALLEPGTGTDLLWPDLLATRTDDQEPAPYWRGRGMGGSSSVNGQIAIRPPLVDFDDWAADGATGWRPADVVPYFCRSEDDLQFGTASHHGRGGPIPVHRLAPSEWGAVDIALHAAALAAGHPWSPDVNAPGAAGVSPYPINSRAGRRVTVNDAYLDPARSLTSLTVRGDALVERVLIESGRAVGVRYRYGGRTVDARAGLVVLSAGAVHSPTVLLRSGIGPADDLRGWGLDVVADLPVGRGLQDHPLTGIVIPLHERAKATTPDARHTSVCVRYSSHRPGCGPLDVLLLALNQNLLTADPDTGLLAVMLGQVHSRGTVTLAGTDPLQQPVVREAMLSDPRDRDRLRTAVRDLADLSRHPAVAAIAERPLAEANPALWAVIDDDQRLDEYLRTTVADAQHATSTCRLGDPAAPTTVVDPDCNVLGIDGLKVVDASIFPSAPRANTHLTTVMAAELTADRILASH